MVLEYFHYVLLYAVVCSGLATENFCDDISSENLEIESYLHRNVRPDSLLISSSQFQLSEGLDVIKDSVLECSRRCCHDESCRSIFFHKLKCYLVRCSFITDQPKLCLSLFEIDDPTESLPSNWTWVAVKEISNISLDDISKLFNERRGNKLHTKADEDTPDVSSVDREHSSQSFLLSPSSTANSVINVTSTAGTVSSYLTSTTSRVTMWVVSAGEARVTRMPDNNLTLSATIAPEPHESVKGEFSYQWVMISSPDNTGSGQMDNMSSPTLKLSMLREGTYLLKVTVTKGDQSNEAFVNVTVLPALKKNEPPVAKIMPSEQKLNQQNDLVLDGSESFDDDKITSYKWELISGPATGTFPTNTVFNSPVFKLKGPLTPAVYKFRLTVADSVGATAQSDATVIVIKEVDYPPKANAGSNQIIQLPVNFVTLEGNASSDNNGIVSYEWTKISNDLVNDMTGARTPFLHLSNLQVGDYTFSLTVTDISNQSDKAEVHVIVKPAQNHPPVADAGSNRTLLFPLAAVNLDATNSTDDNKIASYHWTVLNGPKGAKLENANEAMAKLLNPSVGIYIVRLNVTDDMGLESSATVHITIQQNQNAPPVANAGGDMVVELRDGALVVINGSESSDDRGIRKYRWYRDSRSPAAGIPLVGSDHSPVLQLTDLVRGQYMWFLEVTDVEGQVNKDHMKLTVKDDPKKNYTVRLVLGVEAEMFTGIYRDALQSHLEDLVKEGLNVEHIRVMLRKLSQDPITGRTVIDFYAESREGEQWRLHKGDEVESIVKYKLTTGFSNTLEFPIIEIFAVVCHKHCSGHGNCDAVLRRCVCETFWTSNWFKANFGHKETNCDWSVLYVVIVISIVIVATILLVCYVGRAIHKKLKRFQPIRSQSLAKKRHRYTLLDETPNGIKTNGDAHPRHHLYLSEGSSRGIHPLKVLEDMSDSDTSSEDMIFQRSTNKLRLKTFRRNKTNADKQLLMDTDNQKLQLDEEVEVEAPHDMKGSLS